jgi:hypothetical protein
VISGLFLILIDLEDMDCDGIPDEIDGPTISPVADIAIARETVIPAISFTLSAGHSLPASQTLGAVSSNHTLLPDNSSSPAQEWWLLKKDPTRISSPLPFRELPKS